MQQQRIRTGPVVPITLEDAAAVPGWRDGFAWPVHMGQTVEDLRAVAEGYWRAVVEADDGDLREVVLLARRPTLVYGLVQLARLVAAAREAGADLAGPPEIAALLGASPAGASAAAMREITAPGAPVRLPVLRRILRTASWTPWWRLPRAILAPTAIAMQHNALLRSELRRTGVAAALRYPGDLLGEAAMMPSGEMPGGETPAVDSMAVARHVAGRMTDKLRMPDDIRARLTALMTGVLEEAAREGAFRLERLRARRTMPKSLHLGNGIRSVLRPIALEVLRRGGAVTVYDHGSTYPLTGESPMLAQNEMAVASKVVFASERAAAMPAILQARDMVRTIHPLETAGGAGDPGLDPGPLPVVRPPRGARRRVMYVSGAYYGAQQLFPPLLPAPLYWDWQIRLFGLLKSLPIDLMVKPHPEGVGVPRGLERPADVETLQGRFEAVMARADVFVFDSVTTTTFAVAACTDKPLVLLDTGLACFNPVAEKMIHRRCRVVRATYDDRNRPTVDAAALEDAVCGGADSADSAGFRSLYLGQGA